MSISVIIPTLNEDQNIGRLLDQLAKAAVGNPIEIMVVDGGSKDRTKELVQAAEVTFIQSSQGGRAKQMNLGVEHASGEILYFVHGDTLPPVSFVNDIQQAVTEGYDMGCYRFKFEDDHFLLKINAFFTRFNRSWCRGGDQSLFIKKSVFNQLGGYKEQFVIMEDFELLRRAAGKFRFKVMAQDILVSARKYHTNNYFQVQLANLVVFNMFRFGFQPELILQTYRRMINYRS